jgi:hypothetical protein
MDTKVVFERYPSPHNITEDVFAEQYLYSYLPFVLLTICFLPTISAISSIAYEKENKTSAFLRLNGVPMWLQHAAWLLTSFVKDVIYVLGFTTAIFFTCTYLYVCM